MSYSDPSESAAAKHTHAPINPIEHAFETVVFAGRWIQAPLYGGLIGPSCSARINFSLNYGR